MSAHGKLSPYNFPRFLFTPFRFTLDAKGNVMSTNIHGNKKEYEAWGICGFGRTPSSGMSHVLRYVEFNT